MSEQEKIDAIHREQEMVMISRRAEEEAREHARLLLAWADGKTLQRAEKPGEWIDYVSEKLPVIAVPSCWRIKPEPRRKWEIATAPLGGLRSCSVAFSPFIAERWKARGYTVTEWQEVLP